MYKPQLVTHHQRKLANGLAVALASGSVCARLDEYSSQGTLVNQFNVTIPGPGELPQELVKDQVEGWIVLPLPAICWINQETGWSSDWRFRVSEFFCIECGRSDSLPFPANFCPKCEAEDKAEQERLRRCDNCSREKEPGRLGEKLCGECQNVIDVAAIPDTLNAVISALRTNVVDSGHDVQTMRECVLWVLLYLTGNKQE